jgi:hypothetical protein
MALRVEQDVSVVSVLDLEDVTEQTVSSHGPHEVLLGGIVPPLVDDLFGNAWLSF